MRGSVPSLASPFPLVERLPSVYQEDDFTQRWLSGLDSVIAPVFATLDCIDAYLDPHLAPDDVLAWLGGWVGAVVDDDWPEERRRALVAELSDLHARRGTADGITRLVALCSGRNVEVVEGGGASFSLVPGGPLPGTAAQVVLVQVGPAQPGVPGPDRAALELLIRSACPAHLPVVVEFPAGEATAATRGGGGRPGKGGKGAPASTAGSGAAAGAASPTSGGDAPSAEGPATADPSGE